MITIMRGDARGPYSMLLYDYISLMYLSGYNKLTGYTRSMLLHSEENSRWEIWDIFNNKLYATLNSTAHMPIGVHSWQFVETEGCTNEKTNLNFREM